MFRGAKFSIPRENKKIKNILAQIIATFLKEELADFWLRRRASIIIGPSIKVYNIFGPDSKKVSKNYLEVNLPRYLGSKLRNFNFFSFLQGSGQIF